jgi:hypothetical protein
MIPNPNFLQVSSRRLLYPLNKKLRLQLGLGIQASYDHFNFIAGYRYGLTQWDSQNGYKNINYLFEPFSRMQIVVRHSYLYFGIGYVLAPFSKKTIF